MEQYMTLKEFREYMRYSRSLVDTLLKEGMPKIKPNRKVTVPVNEAVNWIKNRNNK